MLNLSAFVLFQTLCTCLLKIAEKENCNGTKNNLRYTHEDFKYVNSFKRNNNTEAR